MGDDSTQDKTCQAQGIGPRECSCGRKRGKFSSFGMIRVQCDMKSGGPKTIFFMPTKDFSVSYADKKYVALVPTRKSRKAKICGILAPLDDKEKGLRLCLKRCCTDLNLAAVKQCIVEIKVKPKCENCKDCKKVKWSLHSITIPAAGQAK